jgi:hypothetical protein
MRTRVEPQALGRLAAGAFLAACLWGCSSSVFAVHPDQESKYDALWSADWHMIASGQRPLQPSASSPGACNIGGTKQGCYDADVTLIADFRKLAADLSGSAVPSEFARANATLHRGIRHEVQGFSDRNAVIASGNPGATLSQSNKELELGQRAIEQALSEYQGTQLPPSPFK